ncbi:MAG TPA: EAL domain-containing protein [Geobacteraceae bacterium]|nr:EAL domain-containing protein [Geobacteraceae bacterium]
MTAMRMDYPGENRTVPASQLLNTAGSKRMPRLDDSIDNCTHLFTTFKLTLEKSGKAGIVAIHLDYGEFLPDTLMSSVAVLLRVLGRKLAGRVGGMYKSGTQDFFLLLVPCGVYDDRLFRQDLTLIQSELTRLDGHALMNRQILPLGSDRDVSLKVEGVYLSNRIGESSDNALFRAFQELFGAPLQSDSRQTVELAAIEEIINDGLITPVYQAVVHLQNGTIYGYEALSRISRPSIIRNSEELFAKSGSYGLASSLELLCRKKALSKVRELAIPGKIFLNVSPALFQSSDHERGITATLLEELNIERSRVVFELTERTIIEDYDLFLRGVDHYREQGYSIAIDDLGSGYAGLQSLARLEPEYVKLARFLIDAIDLSNTKQALVESLVTFCNKIGALVIAEGIERPEELEYLRSIGVHFGQGYLLGKPSESVIF